MKAKLVAALLGAGLAAALIYLMGVQFAGGDVYPAYSSLRSDRRGTKLLLDSLSRIPGLSVERSYIPFDLLAEDRATVLVLGVDAEEFGKNPATYLSRIEKFAARGNCVVVGLEHDPDDPMPEAQALASMWHVKYGINSELEDRFLYFADFSGWEEDGDLYNKPVVVERQFGKGSVVLWARSGDFANDSVAKGDLLDRITESLGPNRRVLFDEPHLGIVQSGSVAGLVRRYRLTGMFLGLVVCAALFLWKNAAVFPPPEPVAARAFAGRTSLAGLLTLLRRHIAAGEVAAVCWREWHSVHREVSPERARRAGEIAREFKDPLEAAREIQSVLHTKGPL